MSLLNQMRPAPSEKYNRTYGKRTYDPNFNLYKHIRQPNLHRRIIRNYPLGAKPVKIVDTDQKTEKPIYDTPHGMLNREVLDQFANRFVWNSSTMSEYVNYIGWNKKVTGYGSSHEPSSDMYAAISKAPPPYEAGPQEWQEVRATRHGLLDEDKVWHPCTAAPWYQSTPHTPLTWARRLKQLRTEDEEHLVQSRIWDLVKKNDLSYQYRLEIAGCANFKGRDVSCMVPLANPPGQNPLHYQSVTQSTFRGYT